MVINLFPLWADKDLDGGPLSALPKGRKIVVWEQASGGLGISCYEFAIV